MGLRIGIIGLPNVGKSTVFNALVGEQNAQVSNYPFCTIQPNQAVVPVPDPRVERLQQIVGVPNAIHATIQFVDIAGLVRGASKGEGLGNQFLGNIRNTDAILHVVRCFEDPNVVHVSGKIDPRSDIEIINIELVLADLEQLERKIDRLTRQVKGDNKLQPFLELAYNLRTHLQKGDLISTFPHKNNERFQSLRTELRFLTDKSVIYAANVKEDGLTEDNPFVISVCEVSKEEDAECIVLCAKLEEELVGLDPKEKTEYLNIIGLKESGLDQVIRKSYKALNLISFFTKNEREVRAWNIPYGTTAREAAGVIHSDFEKGFIRAEVIPYETYVQFGSDTDVKSAGKMRLEGKNYKVQDGDVILFRFNV